VLKQGGRASTGGTRPSVRNGLATAEIAVATVLLIGAGLLVQSLVQLQRVRLGFQGDGVLTFQISLPAARYPAERATAFYRQFLESIAALPGVRGAAVSSGVPFGQGNYTTSPLSTPSVSVLPKDAAVPVDWRLVSPGFFRTLQIPVLRGRVFTDADDTGAPPVAIVGESTANKFWGADDPIGRILHRVGDGKAYTVIGVVGDVRNTALNQESLTMYLSSATRVWPLMDVVVRSEGSPELSLPGIRRQLRALDPELAMAGVRPMNEWVRASAAQPRLNAVLLGAFAAIAVVVAALGIYGVVAYSVTRRTREIGLRMALGAQPSRVVRLIVREGMTVSLVGVGAGLVSAAGLSRVLTTLVFGVEVRDPATFAGVAAVLIVVALAACSVPARKASAVDPIIALRADE
jgi:putative ABC transport system permease protein